MQRHSESRYCDLGQLGACPEFCIKLVRQLMQGSGRVFAIFGRRFRIGKVFRHPRIRVLLHEALESIAFFLLTSFNVVHIPQTNTCLLYTSDAADEQCMV